ncbi:peptidoglycan bridge formation glycyltransferase FemA/FemB family protein [Xylanimonas allomyrinae]|uniref:Peptidoglycan bridge formation glycyltransferase FemA/FemB family protein n=1 Tax=Xylanimonas allomyrinae TaxID=2509459 RepID=A0A4P6EKX6_9MICO|nr:peptidoglycan bridge formation glycyltransferase FemA/FemB family protein [Xylanimonas allomyrinae]QAY62826.1 peptidoglycan bridge formation glycyltransferase FemA/FemB family protein [Xylanimonas allomyrinae]
MTLRLAELSEDRFAAFVGAAAHASFLQAAPMAAVLRHGGWTVRHVAVLRGDDVVLASRVVSKPMLGGTHAEVQYGPVGGPDAEAAAFFFDAMREYAKRIGALELVVLPDADYREHEADGTPRTEPDTSLVRALTALGYAHGGVAAGYEGGEPGWHFVKDLSGLTDTAALRRSYGKDGLYAVKRAQAFGVRVRRLTRDELGTFKRITAMTSARRGYDDHTLGYYEAFFDAFGRQAQFLLAEVDLEAYASGLHRQIADLEARIAASASPKKQGQRDEWAAQIATHRARLAESARIAAERGSGPLPLAASLFVDSADELVYLFSGSDDTLSQFYGPYAIQDHVLGDAVARGVGRYNMLGIDGVFDGSDGVLRFKQHFSGHVVRKVGRFTYYPSKAKHRLIQVTKRALGRG